MKRIIVAASADTSRENLSRILVSAGYEVFRTCASGGEVRRAVTEAGDCLVVLYGQMPDCLVDDLAWDIQPDAQILLLAKPVLVLKRGKMGVGKVYFGSRERVWRRYINSVLQHPTSIDPRILFVTYVGINKRDMDWIRKQVAKHMTFERIYFQKASPVIAVNCGHGTFGLLIRDADTNPPAAY